jgi:gamma-glutamylcyclotransferase (GGCT)/AIG2-like uncharacterized protein YtfP
MRLSARIGRDAMTAQLHRLFVYGTLMKGEQHQSELADALFMGPAQTLPEYDLMQIDYYPAMVSDGGLRIHGEVYEVDDAQLAKLDTFEEVPGEFVRERISLDDGTEAWTYLMPRHRLTQAEPIASGYFRLRTAPPKKG